MPNLIWKTVQPSELSERGVLSIMLAGMVKKLILLKTQLQSCDMFG